jgi:tRNA uridine 5-carboxymethylaminomethyl modification enzyme
LLAADAERLLGKALDHEYALADLLRRPGVSFDQAWAAAAAAGVEGSVSRETLRADYGRREADTIIDQVEISTKYAGYIDKQNNDIERAAHFDGLPLPSDFDYSQITALSFEVRQTLSRQRPQTLGGASRISGVTPAAISLLLIHLKKARVKGAAHGEAT